MERNWMPKRSCLFTACHLETGKSPRFYWWRQKDWGVGEEERDSSSWFICRRDGQEGEALIQSLPYTFLVHPKDMWIDPQIHVVLLQLIHQIHLWASYSNVCHCKVKTIVHGEVPHTVLNSARKENAARDILTPRDPEKGKEHCHSMV